jgi:ribonuclease BN (tRNA processing enzyme)
MADLTFVGTGEATDPDRPNTSILYRGGCNLLFDCGYSVPRAFWRLTRDPDLLDAIFISHQHGDHTLGLPGLLLWMREAGRSEPLRLVASAATARAVREIIDLAYPGLLENEQMFPVEILIVEESCALGFCTLRVARSDHGEENLALRIEEGAFAVCLSGDGGMTDATRELYRGAELLVHECHRAEPGSPGHANARELFPAAAELGVGRLAVVHVAVGEHEAVSALANETHGLPVLLPSPGDRIGIP